ncbi:protein-disulfide reductase DsbD family protein [Pedobacter nyackensis]|uniref:protein-disulfide reductase DsbD family protein n=1 Tax=Pedobacter nyackensis TaxID=475255 RepID=UPI00292D8BF1|nr:cytochrome c biogenesis protein CcdA [Pedobacter nyackensis]
MTLNNYLTSMKMLVIGLFIFFGTATSVFAQDADTAISDLEFTEIGAETAPVDTVAAAPTSTEVKATKDSTATAVTAVTQEKAEDQSLIGIFITGFIGGLAALLMPCIFPMLPLTVSFFTKGSQSKGTAVSRAMFYGLSIIVIYVVLGLLVTVIFGADALNSLSTNGVFNFLFFVLLMIFAISFLGAFEITLPSSWVNKMDANSDKGGLAGLFFMAGTLALVSFSCTGPIIGTLLVQAATSGALLGPAIGMFGFSFALAIPFALFAMFPSWLSALPKSGGWLNSVKVVLGFLELALAMKFLSNVDLAYHWNWFDREIFLVLWIVIFGLMGLYLLGKLKFSHDSPVNFISIPRLMISIVVLSFTVYMIPGLWGAPLKSISAFLPPQGTQDFDLYTPTLTGGNGGTAAASNHSEGKHKYADIFHAPLNLNVFFDYDEGMAYAKKVGKPVMIDFTGHACVNCRKMEANVWPDKAVYSKLSNDYVIIQLYVDDKTELEESEKYKSTFSGKDVKTIGNKWSDVQASKFNSNSQPYYVLLGHDEKPLVSPTGANYNPEEYLQFLESGLTAFKNK